MEYEQQLWDKSAILRTEVVTRFNNPQEAFKNFPYATGEEITVYCLQNDEDYYKVKVFFDLINNAYNNRG
jgi:hypothetical protein